MKKLGYLHLTTTVDPDLLQQLKSFSEKVNIPFPGNINLYSICFPRTKTNNAEKLEYIPAI